MKTHDEITNELYNKYGLLMCNWIRIIETLKLLINGIEEAVGGKKTKWVYKNGRIISDSDVIKYLERILTQAPYILPSAHAPFLIQQIKKGLSARHKLVHVLGELTRRYIEKKWSTLPSENITVEERQLRIIKRYEWRLMYACMQVDKALRRASVYRAILKPHESESKN